MENLKSWVVKVLENKIFLGWKFLVFSNGKVSKSSLWFLTSDLVFCHLFQTKLAYCYNSLDISASPRTWGRKNNLEGISGVTKGLSILFLFLVRLDSIDEDFWWSPFLPCFLIWLFSHFLGPWKFFIQIRFVLSKI